MSEPTLTWNDALGLVRQDAPGHTAPMAKLPAVHNAVHTVLHLCLLAQQGQLDASRALTTLRSLRAMQQRPGMERAGCLRWFWEETAPVDTNAAFFIGLALELLYLAEGDKLGAPVRTAIREIVADLALWFEHELTDANPRYPNKCLGDLVCGWLAAEVLGRAPSERLVRATREWSTYWHETHWGWGEHMSDIYAMVLLTELSSLLLFARQLPAELRALFQAQFAELLHIDAAFKGGPRVPLIRSYAFTASPPPMPFRDFIRDIAAQAPPPALMVRKPAEAFGAWFFRAGWHGGAASAPAATAEWVEIACHDGALARAVVRPDLRLGAMSRYPIMAGVDQQTWGLSWQTFPAAFWRPAGDWGFWRWTTCEGDRSRAHPALALADAYLGNALTTRVNPPPVPQMISTLSREGRLEMERRLPVPAENGWNQVEDAFWLLNSAAVIAAESTTLTLRWPDAVVHLRWLGDAPIIWMPAARGGRWAVRYDAIDLVGLTELVHRWELTLD